LSSHHTEAKIELGSLSIGQLALAFFSFSPKRSILFGARKGYSEEGKIDGSDPGQMEGEYSSNIHQSSTRVEKSKEKYYISLLFSKTKVKSRYSKV
jgi:hypothetical protein